MGSESLQMGERPNQVHLKVQGLERVVAGRSVISRISFEINEGEIIFVTGPSGVGKTLLLRSIACLDKIQGGSLHMNGKTPTEHGFPSWRSKVSYVPQSRLTTRGTPAELYFQAQQFASQKGRARGDLPSIIHELGLDQGVLNQPWSELSGGQVQRVSLAIAVALRPSILLLDEPTSACDPTNTRRVEKVLKESGASLIWITHDPAQPSRVGHGRILELPMGTLSAPLPAPPVIAASEVEAATLPPEQNLI